MSIVRIILNLLLLGLIVYLANMLINDIKGPIKYEAERSKRYQEVKEKLIDLRKGQIMFKRKYERYSGDIDSLKSFLRDDSVLVVNQVGDPNDSTVVVKMVESWVHVSDSLFKNNPDRINSIDEIPYSGGQKFNVQAGEITKNKVNVKVFEMSAPHGAMYKGLNSKYFDPEERILVGSMTDATTTGNFE